MNRRSGGNTSKDLLFWVECTMAKNVCKEGNVCNKDLWKYCFITVVCESGGIMKDCAGCPARRLGSTVSSEVFLMTCYRMP